MTIELPKVPGDAQPAAVPQQGTPAEGEVQQQGTLTQTPVDAEALRRLESEREKLNRDLNQMKSTFQKREAQLKRESEDRLRQMREELERVQTSTMDEETRKTYEREKADMRVRELEQELANYQQRYEDMQVFQNALNYFRSTGVPDNALAMDGDIDELVASGWNYLANRVKELENHTKLATPPQSPAPLPTAPPVVTGGTSTPPSTKATWEELEKRYGSREKVYQMIEQRRLPGSILPD